HQGRRAGRIMIEPLALARGEAARVGPDGDVDGDPDRIEPGHVGEPRDAHLGHERSILRDGVGGSAYAVRPPSIGLGGAVMGPEELYARHAAERNTTRRAYRRLSAKAGTPALASTQDWQAPRYALRTREPSMRRSIHVLVVALLLAAGCGHTPPPPGTALRDVKFAEAPHLVSRDGRYYLRYRVAFVGGLQLMMLLIGKKTPDKGYYYFSGPLSH